MHNEPDFLLKLFPNYTWPGVTLMSAKPVLFDLQEFRVYTLLTGEFCSATSIILNPLVQRPQSTSND